MERIAADAEKLICDMGFAAYSEARRREHEASSDTIAEDWALVALAVARLICKREHIESATGLAFNVLLIPDRELTRASNAQSRLTRPDELTRDSSPTMDSFRIQYLGASPDGATLKEVEIRASNPSVAIVAAAALAMPQKTFGLRILDCEGHEVFARGKIDRKVSQGATSVLSRRHVKSAGEP
jgi:hypothetical protein